MVEISSYTGTWMSARCPDAPEIGETVRIRSSQLPDGREYDEFVDVVHSAELVLEYIGTTEDDLGDGDVIDLVEYDEYKVRERLPGDCDGIWQ
jgi:hypothetical protein